jgi:hypothetical protein
MLGDSNAASHSDEVFGTHSGLRQGAVRWAQAGVALSVTLHPPHRSRCSSMICDGWMQQRSTFSSIWFAASTRIFAGFDRNLERARKCPASGNANEDALPRSKVLAAAKGFGPEIGKRRSMTLPSASW